MHPSNSHNPSWISFNEKMNSILKKYEPTYWDTMPQQTIYQLYSVEKYSQEYSRLAFMMRGDFVRHLRGIVHVQNPFLHAQFLMKMAECRVNGYVVCRELLHCTAASNVKSIIEDNLDWRLTQRHKFGHGVSFSKSAAYANLQSSLNNGTDRAMIVCDVILGQSNVGARHTVIPIDACDTTVSSCRNVYVKYNDNEFYPKYVIYYKSYAVKSTHGHRYVSKCL